jgi:RNA polymerase sigma factor (sigma-70 family)
MSNSLGSFFGLFNLDPCKRYPDNRLLFEGLQRLDTAAIKCLLLKCRGSVSHLLRQAGMQENNLTDDVLNECVLIFLKKIGDGSYQFTGNAPATYAIAIARRLVSNQTRLKTNQPSVELKEHHQDIVDDSVRDYYENLDNVNLIEKLLSQLGESCQRLIRLKYLDGLSDEETVSQKLTGHNTVESLKVKRSECMKKLRAMAAGLQNKRELF